MQLPQDIGVDAALCDPGAKCELVQIIRSLNTRPGRPRYRPTGRHSRNELKRWRDIPLTRVASGDRIWRRPGDQFVGDRETRGICRRSYCR